MRTEERRTRAPLLKWKNNEMDNGNRDKGKNRDKNRDKDKNRRANTLPQITSHSPQVMRHADNRQGGTADVDAGGNGHVLHMLFIVVIVIPSCICCCCYFRVLENAGRALAWCCCDKGLQSNGGSVKATKSVRGINAAIGTTAPLQPVCGFSRTHSAVISVRNPEHGASASAQNKSAG